MSSCAALHLSQQAPFPCLRLSRVPSASTAQRGPFLAIALSESLAPLSRGQRGRARGTPSPDCPGLAVTLEVQEERPSKSSPLRSPCLFQLSLPCLGLSGINTCQQNHISQPRLSGQTAVQSCKHSVGQDASSTLLMGLTCWHTCARRGG